MAPVRCRSSGSITLPSLRQEIGVCITVTVIAALASFDIVYIATGGGPGGSTTVPGLEIYQLAFAGRQVGLASALAVVLFILVLVCVLPIQRLARGDEYVIVARREILTGRLLLLLLVALTLLPFLSLLSAALHPSDSTPLGIEWPSDPQWGNFVDAFNVAQMPALLWSSVTIVLGVVPVAVVISTMAGFAIGHLRIPGGRFLFLAVPARSHPPVRGDHHAALLPGATVSGS